jgi:general secretion pathway protein J
MKQHVKRGGFTLVELLVAITVLAIVAVLGWRGLDSIVRSRVTLTQQMEHTRGIQLAFAQMQNDLEQLAGEGIVGKRQTLVADNTRLIFVRTQLPDNGATQLVVVSYRLRNGELTRRESPGTRDLAQLDALWQVALGDADTVPGVPLQAGVAAMTVRVWEDSAWQPAPNGTGNAVRAAPTGLEMSLQLQGETSPMTKVLLLGAT